MRRAIQQLSVHARTVMRIQQLRLDQTLRRKIRRTWLMVFALNRYDGRNRRATIVGCEMRFLSFSALAFLFQEIFVGSEYMFLADNDHPYIIDCGSNIGMSICYFKMLYPQSRILAFEPAQEAFTCLEENVTRNGFMDSVQIRNAAVLDREGTTDLFYNPRNPGSLVMSTHKERLPKRRRSVKAVRLSQYIHEDEPVDFLKMDIEGAESVVIEELSTQGKLRHVRQMAIEYHHHITGDVDRFSRLLSTLEDSGFDYQVEGRMTRPLERGQFQDILVYAYQKDQR